MDDNGYAPLSTQGRRSRRDGHGSRIPSLGLASLLVGGVLLIPTPVQAAGAPHQTALVRANANGAWAESRPLGADRRGDPAAAAETSHADATATSSEGQGVQGRSKSPAAMTSAPASLSGSNDHGNASNAPGCAYGAGGVANGVTPPHGGVRGQTQTAPGCDHQTVASSVTTTSNATSEGALDHASAIAAGQTTAISVPLPSSPDGAVVVTVTPPTAVVVRAASAPPNGATVTVRTPSGAPAADVPLTFRVAYTGATAPSATINGVPVSPVTAQNGVATFASATPPSGQISFVLGAAVAQTPAQLPSAAPPGGPTPAQAAAGRLPAQLPSTGAGGTAPDLPSSRWAALGALVAAAVGAIRRRRGAAR